jgi:hypothetical protein
MLSSPVGIAITAIVAVVAGVIVVTVVSLGLAVTGSPGSCTPGGGPITVSDANVAAFQQKWDAFDQLLDAGSPTSATFSESEVTSRAAQFIEEETGVDVDDLQICFHDGFAEVSGKLSSGIGVGSKVRIQGTVDLSGERATASVDEVEIGAVPGLLVDVAETIGLDANDALNEALDELNLQHRYVPMFSEGSVEVSGRP